MKYEIRTTLPTKKDRDAILEVLAPLYPTVTEIPEVVSTTETFRVEIEQDNLGNQLQDDPRTEWGEDAPRLFVLRCGYNSTLTRELVGDDRTIDAYLRAEDFLNEDKAVTFAQRYENIFGSGRPVTTKTISGYSQSDWMEVLVIGEDNHRYLDEFEAWWNNEFYTGYLIAEVTEHFDDGSTHTFDEVREFVDGIMVYDFDWSVVLETLEVDKNTPYTLKDGS